MTILDEIIETKHKEVAERKELYPTKLLEKSLYFEGAPVSLTNYLAREDLFGVIAEIKRKSPSKGAINEYVDIETVSIGYMQGGASALSVLTDSEYFGGSSEDLTLVRSLNYCPILRKDFIVDEYQVIEARSIGADAILLIASVLSEEQMTQLGKLTRSLKMEVLVEVHNEEELKKVPLSAVDIIGVNNRDLKTFTVDLETSLKLGEQIPSSHMKISESGIHTAEDLVTLKKNGFNGFLIGERFMRESRPHDACKALIEEASRLIGN